MAWPTPRENALHYELVKWLELKGLSRSAINRILRAHELNLGSAKVKKFMGAKPKKYEFSHTVKKDLEAKKEEIGDGKQLKDEFHFIQKRREREAEEKSKPVIQTGREKDGERTFHYLLVRWLGTQGFNSGQVMRILQEQGINITDSDIYNQLNRTRLPLFVVDNYLDTPGVAEQYKTMQSQIENSDKFKELKKAHDLASTSYHIVLKLNKELKIGANIIENFAKQQGLVTGGYQDWLRRHTKPHLYNKEKVDWEKVEEVFQAVKQKMVGVSSFYEAVHGLAKTKDLSDSKLAELLRAEGYESTRYTIAQWKDQKRKKSIKPLLYLEELVDSKRVKQIRKRVLKRWREERGVQMGRKPTKKAEEKKQKQEQEKQEKQLKKDVKTHVKHEVVQWLGKTFKLSVITKVMQGAGLGTTFNEVKELLKASAVKTDVSTVWKPEFADSVKKVIEGSKAFREEHERIMQTNNAYRIVQLLEKHHLNSSEMSKLLETSGFKVTSSEVDGWTKKKKKPLTYKWGVADAEKVKKAVKRIKGQLKTRNELYEIATQVAAEHSVGGAVTSQLLEDHGLDVNQETVKSWVDRNVVPTGYSKKMKDAKYVKGGVEAIRKTVKEEGLPKKARSRADSAVNFMLVKWMKKSGLKPIVIHRILSGSGRTTTYATVIQHYDRTSETPPKVFEGMEKEFEKEKQAINRSNVFKKEKTNAIRISNAVEIAQKAAEEHGVKAPTIATRLKEYGYDVTTGKVNSWVKGARPAEYHEALVNPGEVDSLAKLLAVKKKKEKKRRGSPISLDKVVDLVRVEKDYGAIDQELLKKQLVNWLYKQEKEPEEIVALLRKHDVPLEEWEVHKYRGRDIRGRVPTETAKRLAEIKDAIEKSDDAKGDNEAVMFSTAYRIGSKLYEYGFRNDRINTLLREHYFKPRDISTPTRIEIEDDKQYKKELVNSKDAKKTIKEIEERMRKDSTAHEVTLMLHKELQFGPDRTMRVLEEHDLATLTKSAVRDWTRRKVKPAYYFPKFVDKKKAKQIVKKVKQEVVDLNNAYSITNELMKDGLGKKTISKFLMNEGFTVGQFIIEGWTKERAKPTVYRPKLASKNMVTRVVKRIKARPDYERKKAKSQRFKAGWEKRKEKKKA